MDLNTIHEENDVIETKEELARVKAELKLGKAYLFNYDDGTPKSLYDLLSFITRLLQDSYKSPIKRLQLPYQEITGLLSRDYRTPIKRL